MESGKLKCLVESHSTLGEGPLWDQKEKCLWWVDIEGRKIHRYDPVTGENRSIEVAGRPSTIVPRESGGVIYTMEREVLALDFQTAESTVLARIPEVGSEVRFNDGKCDPAGRLWAGTMGSKDGQGIGALYCIDTDLSFRRMVEGVAVSNGIVWSLDHKILYYIDTFTREVAAYDYDLESGDISNRRVAVLIDEKYGFPDGMSIDAEGMLWIAHWGGAAVRRWNPMSGELLNSISIPAQQVTACAFGGEDLHDLYITTATSGFSNEDLLVQPRAGNLFMYELEVAGVPAFSFKGSVFLTGRVGALPPGIEFLSPHS
ncbi:MAG: SMP-30/gluconolactonase/LRE family protein [Opitutaceae bacterium]|nr:SMP-30/gluconolactonase/LRE family protein [Opitutaceae bacterium]